MKVGLADTGHWLGVKPLSSEVHMQSKSGPAVVLRVLEVFQKCLATRHLQEEVALGGTEGRCCVCVVDVCVWRGICNSVLNSYSLGRQLLRVSNLLGTVPQLSLFSHEECPSHLYPSTQHLLPHLSLHLLLLLY